jgi:hypothetical protein
MGVMPLDARQASTNKFRTSIDGFITISIQSLKAFLAISSTCTCISLIKRRLQASYEVRKCKSSWRKGLNSCLPNVVTLAISQLLCQRATGSNNLLLSPSRRTQRFPSASRSGRTALYLRYLLPLAFILALRAKVRRRRRPQSDIESCEHSIPALRTTIRGIGSMSTPRLDRVPPQLLPE